MSGNGRFEQRRLDERDHDRDAVDQQEREPDHAAGGSNIELAQTPRQRQAPVGQQVGHVAGVPPRIARARCAVFWPSARAFPTTLSVDPAHPRTGGREASGRGGQALPAAAAPRRPTPRPALGAALLRARCGKGYPARGRSLAGEHLGASLLRCRPSALDLGGPGYRCWACMAIPRRSLGKARADRPAFGAGAVREASGRLQRWRPVRERMSRRAAPGTPERNERANGVGRARGRGWAFGCVRGVLARRGRAPGAHRREEALPPREDVR